VDGNSPRPPVSTPLLPVLTPAGRLRLAAEVLATYGEVRWRMRRGDLRETTRALRSRTDDDQWAEPAIETYWQAVRLAKAVKRTLALLPTDSRCLMQSLVLTGMLSRRGISSVLVVAVSPGPEFKAHAWVEHGGGHLLPRGEFGRLLEL